MRLPTVPRPCLVLIACAAVFLLGTDRSARAQDTAVLTTIHSFGTLSQGYYGNNADGAEPGGLTLDNDGNLYGVTVIGGTKGAGTIFKITPDGTLTTLHNFDGSAEGTGNGNPLFLASDGNFYGTAGDGLSATKTAWRVRSFG